MKEQRDGTMVVIQQKHLCTGGAMAKRKKPELSRLRGLGAISVSGRQTGMNLLIEPPSLGSFAVKGIIDLNLMGSDAG